MSGQKPGTVEAGDICLIPVEVTDAFQRLGENMSQHSAATFASRPSTRSGKSAVPTFLSQWRTSTPAPTLRSQGGGRIADRRLRPTVICAKVRTKRTKAVYPQAFIFGEYEADSPELPTLLRIYSRRLDEAALGLKTKDGAVAHLPPLGSPQHTFKSVILHKFTLPGYAGVLPSTDRLKVDGSPVTMDIESSEFKRLELLINMKTAESMKRGNKSLAELKNELREFYSTRAVSSTWNGHSSTPPSSAMSTSPTSSGSPRSLLSSLSSPTSGTSLTSSAASPVQSSPNCSSILNSRRVPSVRLALDMSKLHLTGIDEDPLQTVGPTQSTFTINTPPAESNGTSPS